MKEKLIGSIIVIAMTVGFLTVANWNVERLNAIDNQMVEER
jgi:hypothetical protein